jgi:hypothetical protein
LLDESPEGNYDWNGDEREQPFLVELLFFDKKCIYHDFILIY